MNTLSEFTYFLNALHFVFTESTSIQSAKVWFLRYLNNFAHKIYHLFMERKQPKDSAESLVTCCFDFVLLFL